ncbi:MAG: Abi family protein [Faecalicoccus sp.]|nr:Abi family protein [Faecalicoccus sp.]
MPNNHVDKPFLTYEQMLELLESRNVLIVNHDFAKGLLASVSYYTLINGYKHMFSFDKNNRFDPPVLFEDFHILHQFIFELSNFLLKNIINIENSLKSHLSYIVSKNYGVETDLEDSHRLGDTDYLAKVHYRNSSLSGGILNAIREQALKSKNVSLIHYRNNHNHIPCRILVNGIPFGLSIEWYRILKAIDKQYICN